MLYGAAIDPRRDRGRRGAGRDTRLAGGGCRRHRLPRRPQPRHDRRQPGPRRPGGRLARDPDGIGRRHRAAERAGRGRARWPCPPSSPARSATVLVSGEVVAGVRVPRPAPDARWGYWKFTRKTRRVRQGECRGAAGRRTLPHRTSARWRQVPILLPEPAALLRRPGDRRRPARAPCCRSATRCLARACTPSRITRAAAIARRRRRNEPQPKPASERRARVRRSSSRAPTWRTCVRESIAADRHASRLRARRLRRVHADAGRATRCAPA